MSEPALVLVAGRCQGQDRELAARLQRSPTAQYARLHDAKSVRPKRGRRRHAGHSRRPIFRRSSGLVLGEGPAYRVWALRLDPPEGIRLLGDLFDRYVAEVVPAKAPKTQVSNHLSLRRLRLVFCQVPVSAIKPRHAYRYRDEVTRKHGAASANRDLEVLSHALSKAVEWGLIDRNPVKGQVRKNRIKRRERYVENWELAQALSVASPMLRAYISLKLQTALRRGDLLRLKSENLQADGIHVRVAKTGTDIIISWTDELRETVDQVLASRPVTTTGYLFATRNGTSYVGENGNASSFNSLWQRFMRLVLVNTDVTDRFQEKDLRKKTASDMPEEHAYRLLGHHSPEVTKRHYRLKGNRVVPHSLRKTTR